MDFYLPIIDIDITEEEQMLPFALQDLSPNDSILMDMTVCLNDFITKFKNNQKNFVEQRNIEMEFEFSVFI